MTPLDKPLVWLRGEVKTPPFSREARIEVGVLLRRLQRRETLSLPHSRPMPDVGARCHELRIVDRDKTRVTYVDFDRDPPPDVDTVEDLRAFPPHPATFKEYPR